MNKHNTIFGQIPALISRFRFEKEELTRLRKENKALGTANEILKKAAEF